MEKTIIYFEKPGRDNTRACLDVVQRAVKECGYRHLVVATTVGDTGLLFSEALKGQGLNVVVVTHAAGFKEPNTSEISRETRQQIAKSGAVVYTGSMLTHSLETAIAPRSAGAIRPSSSQMP